ncbi:hypothetical protein [Silvanigrella aquatica]|uniref:Uncharacterized protein n=1 Tax=Silvanigrella aquatica TaxID=1915309 RepID=A0A1L4CY29_9BACT|nr:hypothetical protein [Silvanigrella aquatica]APJ02862.1 hypothetical protein AXG55_02570 [Silvanigrella aquatica]
MSFKKNLFRFFLIYFLISSRFLFANEVYVYCADKKENWQWLKNNNEYVKVEGDWGEKLMNYSSYFYYFIPKGGLNEINILKQMCLKNFGNDFIYPQPGYFNSSYWSVFAYNSNEIYVGHITHFIIWPTSRNVLLMNMGD